MKPGIRFGILGGGQLARMMALSAHQMGLIPWILSESEGDPAQQVCPNGMIGKLNDKKTLNEIQTVRNNFYKARFNFFLSAGFTVLNFGLLSKVLSYSKGLIINTSSGDKLMNLLIYTTLL